MIFFTNLDFLTYKIDLVFLMNQIQFFIYENITKFFKRRGHIHEVDLCDLV